MSEEIVQKVDESSPKYELIPALASPEFVPGLDLPVISPSESSSTRESLPTGEFFNFFYYLFELACALMDCLFLI